MKKVNRFPTPFVIVAVKWEFHGKFMWYNFKTW